MPNLTVPQKKFDLSVTFDITLEQMYGQTFNPTFMHTFCLTIVADAVCFLLFCCVTLLCPPRLFIHFGTATAIAIWIAGVCLLLFNTGWVTYFFLENGPPLFWEGRSVGDKVWKVTENVVGMSACAVLSWFAAGSFFSVFGCREKPEEEELIAAAAEEFEVDEAGFSTTVVTGSQSQEYVKVTSEADEYEMEEFGISKTQIEREEEEEVDAKVIRRTRAIMVNYVSRLLMNLLWLGVAYEGQDDVLFEWVWVKREAAVSALMIPWLFLGWVALWAM